MERDTSGKTGASRHAVAIVVVLVATVVAWTWFVTAGRWAASLTDLAWNDLLTGLLLVCVWVGARFFRWQFLLRRAAVRVPIRRSLSIFLAGLAGLATPGMLGEGVRVALLGSLPGVSVKRAFDAFATERFLDLAVVGVLTAVVAPSAFTVTLALGAILVPLAGAAVSPLTFRSARALVSGRDGLWAVFATTLAWAPVLLVASNGVPDGALDLLLTGGRAEPAVLGALFVAAPVLGGVVGVARLISPVEEHGSSSQAEHFDSIADEYLDQWSPHVWSHLIGRKVGLMADRLEPGMTGLDFGCGAGLQVVEMGKRGFDVIGIDPSRELVAQARRAGAAGLAADGRDLPFAPETFDFVYAVGVLHHVPGPAAQGDVLREIERVLKPGGQLLVHETNPRNPLFRFYMGYVFPLLKDIDEGTEWWIDDRTWVDRPGFEVEQVEFFTFIPDFLPAAVMKPFLALERILERSALRAWSVHYFLAVRTASRGPSRVRPRSD